SVRATTVLSGPGSIRSRCQTSHGPGSTRSGSVVSTRNQPISGPPGAGRTVPPRTRHSSCAPKQMPRTGTFARTARSNSAHSRRRYGTDSSAAESSDPSVTTRSNPVGSSSGSRASTTSWSAPSSASRSPTRPGGQSSWCWTCRTRTSAPGERRVARRVQLTGLVAREAERLEQLALLPEQLPGDELPDADHLVTVVGVGDHVGVLTEPVADREADGGEGAEAARGLVAVERALALEPLVAVCQRRGPHPREVLPHGELRARGAVGVDRDLRSGPV